MSPLQYTKAFFDPKENVRRIPRDPNRPGDADSVYVFEERIVLALNVALATGRPLLVRGKPGTGKSTLAKHAAAILDRRYLERAITSRTQARDLLYEVDLLRRLHDAQAKPAAAAGFDPSYDRYVRPGVLWDAFAPRTTQEEAAPAGAADRRSAVVLLDEIDKADPDVPNDLLVPLGALRFTVEETGVTYEASAATAPLVILTTNEERVLPKAFLRRCVELDLGAPARARLREIALAHFPKQATRIDEVLTALLGPETAGAAGQEVELSPAELVDTLRAAERLGVAPKPGGESWEALRRITTFKKEAREGRT